MNQNNPSRKHSSRLSTPVRLGVAAVAACFLAAPVLSNPVNPTVVNGSATFNQVGNVLTVTNSNGAIINWDKFSIKAGETTHFAQTSASSSVLNRVLNDPTAIYGTLSSNGRVWLVNPAGIMVGGGGRVDVAGFVASTLNITNADFLAGRNLFVNDGSAKDVINQGEITTPAGGSVYLIGSNVSNEGIITTPQGETILAAGATVSLIDSALPGVKVDITGAAGNSTNLGTITAEAGRIGIAGVIVRNSGTLNASSVVADGGRIFLKASQDAYVDGNGRIITTGTRGGSVEVLGNRVAVMDNASIDASGVNGGGTIKVGGDYQGKNPDIQNANITYFGPDATLKADATKVGDGGTVIVWADDTTRAYGTISAKGGASGGNGGFVETSGKRYLDVSGIEVSTAAPNGSIGTWLLDPTDITIVHSASYGGATFTGSIFDNGGGSTATLSDYDINANLASNSITITTSSAGYGGGDITFDASAGAGGAIFINNGSGAARTLTLVADNDIKFIGGGTTFQTTAANSPLTVNFDPATNRKVEVQSGATLTFSGFNATSAASAAMVLPGPVTKTWENFGTVNLSGESYFDLETAGYYAAFNNKSGGVLNLGSSFNWSFLSDSGPQNGPLNNAGTINVNTPTSWEARFSQGSGGILNINGSAALSMQHLDVAMGTINLNSSASYALTLLEQHAGQSKFDGASIVGVSGPKRIQIGTSGSTSNTTTFNNVSTSGGLEVLAPELGTLNFTGANTFANTKFFKGDAGANKNWVIPVATYLGNVEWWATGNISFAGNVSFGGSVTLGAGWDSNIAIPGVTAGSGLLQITGGQVSSGGGMTLKSGNGITLTDATVSSGGTMNVAAQSLNINAVTGPARLISQGNQTVTLGTGAANSSLQLISTNGEARLSTYGSQVITFNGSAANTLQLQGSDNNTTYGGNAARIEAGGTQSITKTSGSLAISLVAGTGTATYGGSSYNDYGGPTQTLICATCATHNEAQIRSTGAQTISATSIDITGGGGGNGNWAGIESKANSTVVATGAVTIVGGSSGGAYFGPNAYVSNDAGIGADGNLSLTAGSISLSGGNANYGGAYIGGGNAVTVVATGAISLTGGTAAGAIGSPAYGVPLPDNFIWFNPAIIGSDKGSLANMSVTAGTTLTLAGGPMGANGGSFAAIGGVRNTPVNMTINASSVSLTSSTALADRIGSSAGGAVTINAYGGLALGKGAVGTGRFNGGSLSLNVTGPGNITQALTTEGQITTDYLNTLALSGTIGLISFENRVGNVNATTTNQTITFNGQSVGLGTINSGTGSSTISALYDIHDNNGLTTNITAGSVSLYSTSGGTAGSLAISADTVTSGNIVGSVSGGASGGIYIRNSGGTPSSVILNDSASANTSAKFYNDTTYSTAPYSLTALYGGTLGFLSGGDLNYNGGTFNTGGNGKIGMVAVGTLNMNNSLAGGVNHIALGGATINVNSTITTTGDVAMGGGVINIGSASGGFVTAQNVVLGAGTLNVGTVGGSGGITANNQLLAVVTGDVNILGHMYGSSYIRTIAGDLEMLVGGNLKLTGYDASYDAHIWAGYTKMSPYFPDASIAVGGDIKLNNGGHIYAANDVYLDLLGGSSKLIMNDGTPGYDPSYVMSDIGTQVVGTTHLAFTGRSAGGIVIDGIETTTTVVGGSGFFAVNSSTPATAGAGLNVTYANVASDLCAISPALCRGPDTDPNPPPPPSKPDPGKKASCTPGSFGCDDEDKDKPDQAKDEKKDDKAAAKKIVQCGGF
ncbi:MAG: filamentous hemagglutinin N-terminal domain-containing protein [Sulfuritalea sp.]|nr:filamentous hemagglutinin N-terminal domain-containing protein [Sulfuritalea sp.]